MEDATLSPATLANTAEYRAVVDELRSDESRAALAREHARMAPVPTPIQRDLRGHPPSFDAFQVVRLLHRLYPRREPLGRFVDPSAELVRFAVPTSIAFPASEVQSLDLGPDRDTATPPRMLVNFFGLTGPQGVLPHLYTLYAAERARARDTAFRDFLDLFHHRVVSLLYRAWEKTHFVVEHEREGTERLLQHALDLVGLGTPAVQARLPLRRETLAFYAGLLGIAQRPAESLRQLLADYFDVPVEIEQFVGGWFRLQEPWQCRVDDDGDDASSQLGLGAVAGDEVWDTQSRARVRVGPLTREQYDRFLPSGDAHEALRALARFFGNDQVEFEVQLVLARDEVPGCRLGVDEAEQTPLGWSTWLKSKPLGHDPDETVLVM